MTTLKPTAEQEAIIDAYAGGEHLVIEAGAGTGKTSTLKLLAARTPGRRGVYIAYNRAIANDAQRSFPTWVTCKTAHSFAYGAVGRHFRHRLNGPRVPAQVAARTLRLNDPVKIGDVMLSPHQLARLVGEAVSRFCYTGDDHIGRMHVPMVNGLDKPGQAELARYLVPIAQRAWDEDITQTGGRLRFTHDHYLKMWTLSRPQLPADYVLLDEAQDSNGCVAGLVTDQQAQRIWVGDRSQAIYGWRGAVDAMEHAPGRRLWLSQSFRFGPAVAAEANKWLELLGAPLRLTGHDPIPSRVEHLAEADAVLCRTNAGAITQAIAAIGRGGRPALVGGGQDIRRMAEAAEQLQQTGTTAHPELFAFSSWPEVRQYVEHESEGSDLRVLVRLIDQHGPRELIRIVDSLADERHADLVLSTAHKAKGREWPRVRIATDFQEPKPAEDGTVPEPARDECMLAYVAVTRAQEVLDREGLEWVDRYIVDHLEPTGDEVAALTPTQRERLAGVAAVAPAYVAPVDPAAEPVPERVAPAPGTALEFPAAARAAAELETGTDPAARVWEDLRADREAMLAGKPLCPGCETHGDLLDDGLCVTCSVSEVQADGESVWIHHAGDQPDHQPDDLVLVVPHCYRCGSDGCICDPDLAAQYSARNDVPAGPRPAREAWSRNRLAGSGSGSGSVTRLAGSGSGSVTR